LTVISKILEYSLKYNYPGLNVFGPQSLLINPLGINWATITPA